MKQKNRIFTLLVCILSTATFVAQLDKSNGAKNKGKIKATVLKNTKATEMPNSVELLGNKGFEKAYDKEQEKLKKKQEEDNLKNKGIISKKQRENRMLLRKMMLQNGFKPYENEWWHFTLKEEPFPKTYFNFFVN